MWIRSGGTFLTIFVIITLVIVEILHVFTPKIGVFCYYVLVESSKFIHRSVTSDLWTTQTHMKVHHINGWGPWSYCIITLSVDHVPMFFSLCMLCWTRAANDPWLRIEIMFLMMCPRLIIWEQILVRRCELGPLGPSLRFLASARVCKFKKFMQVEWDEQVFNWFSFRMLTCKQL